MKQVPDHHGRQQLLLGLVHQFPGTLISWRILLLCLYFFGGSRKLNIQTPSSLRETPCVRCSSFACDVWVLGGVAVPSRLPFLAVPKSWHWFLIIGYSFAPSFLRAPCTTRQALAWQPLACVRSAIPQVSIFTP